jgi:hypothetical protein
MLRKLTLNLARNPRFPEGSRQHGYVIVAPVDGHGHLDPDAYHKDKSLCVVRRFWNGEPDRVGTLVHKAGGHGGASWVIDYDPSTDEDDEVSFRLDAHKLAQGEYVSIRDNSGDIHTFRIIESIPL